MTATVTNTGAVAGAEVVQVYLGVPDGRTTAQTTRRVPKVYLEPGESKRVTITVDPAATNHPFGVWDYGTQGFQTLPGDYTVYVGTSADNTPHAVTFGSPSLSNNPR